MYSVSKGSYTEYGVRSRVWSRKVCKYSLRKALDTERMESNQSFSQTVNPHIPLRLEAKRSSEDSTEHRYRVGRYAVSMCAHEARSTPYLPYVWSAELRRMEGKTRHFNRLATKMRCCYPIACGMNE